MSGAAGQTVTFRPGFARGITIAAVVLAAVAIVWTAAEDPAAGLRTTPAFLLLPTAVWALYWRPAVVVSDGGVELRNVLRTVELPWPAIQRIDFEYALTLHTVHGAYAAWAVPAPSRTAAAHTTRRFMQSQPETAYDAGGLRPGRPAGTSSGDAAAYLRRRWEALRDAGVLEDPSQQRARPHVHWHLGPVAVFAVLAALALMLPRLT